MEDNGASSYHRFLKGDDESLREIIISYQPGLILYIYSILNDYQTAEEVAEDTFLELAMKRPNYSGKSSFKTWLYAIANHLCSRYTRGDNDD
ncbi:MAG: RNA polymerase sigma factor [Lachnospiraceae bacterium]|nr:RNA polymerase sigma factor [Lachnospiraceae bacterium]